jgi:hypothetical protein
VFTAPIIWLHYRPSCATGTVLDASFNGGERRILAALSFSVVTLIRARIFACRTWLHMSLSLKDFYEIH